MRENRTYGLMRGAGETGNGGAGLYSTMAKHTEGAILRSLPGGRGRGFKCVPEGKHLGLPGQTASADEQFELADATHRERPLTFGRSPPCGSSFRDDVSNPGAGGSDAS